MKTFERHCILPRTIAEQRECSPETVFIFYHNQWHIGKIVHTDIAKSEYIVKTTFDGEKKLCGDKVCRVTPYKYNDIVCDDSLPISFRDCVMSNDILFMYDRNTNCARVCIVVYNELFGYVAVDLTSVSPVKTTVERVTPLYELVDATVYKIGNTLSGISKDMLNAVEDLPEQVVVGSNGLAYDVVSIMGLLKDDKLDCGRDLLNFSLGLTLSQLNTGVSCDGDKDVKLKSYIELHGHEFAKKLE